MSGTGELRNPLLDVVGKNKGREKRGIASICSSNGYVVAATLEWALSRNESALIEATANQVNQFGGYTGMKPHDFVRFVHGVADHVGFPKDKLILGGDHLGPLAWQDQDSSASMKMASDLVSDYVRAGFTKIHIDTSMMLGGDRAISFDDRLIAERGAALCEACERTFDALKSARPQAVRPAYVIGSEVPKPGGSQNGDEEPSVTEVEDFHGSVETFKEAFLRRGLPTAWGSVMAVVVQLGVEFGDDRVNEYERARAADLSRALVAYPTLVFEGHSTDFQTRESLREMVEDGVAILKVGPALTFAFREALFALSMMEDALSGYQKSIEPSHFIEVLERTMVQDPDNWKRHYHGTPERLAFDRKYSFSDRCRYYLPSPAVKDACDLLIRNLRAVRPPLSLISQFMPRQYALIRSGLLECDPEALMKSRIRECLDEYGYAMSGA
jgi:D-tagatose-1,6-bisphosphate aldolase subunit GatZ/KbaZ